MTKFNTRSSMRQLESKTAQNRHLLTAALSKVSCITSFFSFKWQKYAHLKSEKCALLYFIVSMQLRHIFMTFRKTWTRAHNYCKPSTIQRPH